MTTDRPLRTEVDYDNAIAEVGRLWGAEQGSADGDRLDVLMDMVIAYEKIHYPMDIPPDLAA